MRALHTIAKGFLLLLCISSDGADHVHLLAEHQRGYTLHDRLLRPAMVTVGKGPADGDGSREPTRH